MNTQKKLILAATAVVIGVSAVTLWGCEHHWNAVVLIAAYLSAVMNLEER